jgi:hypothetical protein
MVGSRTNKENHHEAEDQDKDQIKIVLPCQKIKDLVHLTA